MLSIWWIVVGLAVRLGRLDLAVEVGDEAPEREREGDALGAVERLAEQQDGEHLGDRDEHSHDHAGQQRRAEEDGADGAEEEALVRGGRPGEKQVVACPAETELPRLFRDCLRFPFLCVLVISVK
jgi:hypothetical protein